MEICMAPENARLGSQAPSHVLHVNMENAVVEFTNEPHVVHALITKVAGVVVEPKRRMVVQCLERTLGRGDVERDFRGVNFQCVANAEFLKLIENGDEALGKVRVAGIKLTGHHGRKGIAEVPDAGTGEPIHHTHTKALGGVRGLDQFCRRPLTHALGIAIAINVVGQNLRMTGVDVVADRLADQVGGDGVALQASSLQLSAFLVAISLIGLGHFKMIPPAT